MIMCILFKLVHMCMQANVATHVQASSHVCMSVSTCPHVCMYFIADFRTCNMQYVCCIEIAANLYRI